MRLAKAGARMLFRGCWGRWHGEKKVFGDLTTERQIRRLRRGVPDGIVGVRGRDATAPACVTGAPACGVGGPVCNVRGLASGVCMHGRRAGDPVSESAGPACMAPVPASEAAVPAGLVRVPGSAATTLASIASGMIGAATILNCVVAFFLLPWKPPPAGIFPQPAERFFARKCGFFAAVVAGWQKPC